MPTQAEENKAIIRRYNQEGIAQGNAATLRELLSPGFINHSAPAGADNGPAGMLYTFLQVLRPAFADLQVEVYDQVAEADKVTTRKALKGTHTGELLGIAPTGQAVVINVIDIYRLHEGKLVEHWGVNTLPAVLAQLATH
ncbi:ester cyclase [Hymenobacter chitinivorans]|uniref:SnoaL-like polyketide cyclase n=1 Tax=Hymenobacter chitinivorans DSM 11115 TaxID=1121954 RepID=A0A2M9BL00_9BACT|nr:ester cyclase [Hymenobacter chitinivorans]PJJ58624.1 SnoaL-like polyketide cyclase [Hymenobacter chitinivorans DSM 11115]